MMRSDDGRPRFLLRGGLISPAARDWLRRAERPAILSLHRASLNLLDETWGLISLTLPEIGPGPFAMVVHPDDPSFHSAGGFGNRLTLEDPIRLGDSRLVVGSLSVGLTDLAHWEPRPPWDHVHREKLFASVGFLFRLLKQHAPAGSLAPLLGMGEPSDSRAYPELQAAVLRAAQSHVEGLLAGVNDRSEEQLGRAAGQLAGLGGGITPAGDDFLIGAMHALWALLEPDTASHLSKVIADRAAPRTNRISAAWLAAAARGEAAQPWHALLAALADGARSGLSEAGMSLIGIGHTSGADALAGFVALVRACGKEELRRVSAQSSSSNSGERRA